MLTRDTITERLRDRYPYLAAEFGVRRIGLFGSFAKGTANEASDVDVVVEFQRPIGLRFVELVEYLEQLLGRKVDVLTPAGLQAIRLKDVARHISESVVYVQPRRP
jgi:predicted nucleotidyltransferase